MIFQEASHESDEGEKEDEEPAGVTENTHTKKNVQKKSAPIIRKVKTLKRKGMRKCIFVGIGNYMIAKYSLYFSVVSNGTVPINFMYSELFLFISATPELETPADESTSNDENTESAENPERDNSSEGSSNPKLKKYDEDGQKIYLGLGKWMDKFIWEAIQVKTPWKFLRDVVRVFWNPQVLANRCLDPKKTIISFQGRSPRKVLTPKKYKMTQGLYNSYLNINY